MGGGGGLPFERGLLLAAMCHEDLAVPEDPDPTPAEETGCIRAPEDVTGRSACWPRLTDPGIGAVLDSRRDACTTHSAAVGSPSARERRDINLDG